jgi:hypothetical protein
MEKSYPEQLEEAMEMTKILLKTRNVNLSTIKVVNSLLAFPMTDDMLMKIDEIINF